MSRIVSEPTRRCSAASRYVFKHLVISQNRWVRMPARPRFRIWDLDTNSRCAVAATILQNDLCNGVPQPSRSGYTIRVTIIVTAFTYFIFALRCISRYMVARRIWWDDFALISAVVSFPWKEREVGVLSFDEKMCTVPMTVISIYSKSNFAHTYLPLSLQRF